MEARRGPPHLLPITALQSSSMETASDQEEQPESSNWWWGWRPVWQGADVGAILKIWRTTSFIHWLWRQHTPVSTEPRNPSNRRPLAHVLFFLSFNNINFFRFIFWMLWLMGRVLGLDQRNCSFFFTLLFCLTSTGYLYFNFLLLLFYCFHSIIWTSYSTFFWCKKKKVVFPFFILACFVSGVLLLQNNNNKNYTDKLRLLDRVKS